MKSDTHLCGSDTDPGRSTYYKTTNFIKGDFYNGITRREDNR